MSNDPNIYRSPVRTIGNVEDEAATNSTDGWSIPSLLKGVYHLLSGTITVTTPVGGATAANQATEIASLASIDGHVDGLETLAGTGNTALAAILAKVIAAPATEAKQDSAITQETAINTVLGTTAGAAVITSTAGTIQGYLRGIVSLLVSGITVASHAVTNAGTFAVQSSVADGANVVEGAVADAVVAAGASGSISAKLRAISRDLIANIVLAAGTNLIGRTVADASAATGGIASTARLPSAAASTNATNVKTSAGRVYSVCGKNNAGYDVFLVLYDSAANPPVPGSTTIRKKVPCPAGQAFVYDFDLGLSFASGIGYAFTKLVADADTTVLVAADVTAFNLDYV